MLRAGDTLPCLLCWWGGMDVVLRGLQSVGKMAMCRLFFNR